MTELLIVTGMSGAGKTLAMNALEDIGYYCVDNIPAELLPKLADLLPAGTAKMKKTAIGVDVRGNRDGSVLEIGLDALKRHGISYEILFLDAEDPVLERRFKETRRRHPLCLEGDISLQDALKQERAILTVLRNRATYYIDTSLLSTALNRERIQQLFMDTGDNTYPMDIAVISFGFKYGLPSDADLVFDVRCLPNPFYVPELKHKTGLDADVVDYVMDAEESHKVLEQIENYLNLTLPLYVKEGKSLLTIATGCTGGKHRSVTFARLVGDWCKRNGYRTNILHRDIER